MQQLINDLLAFSNAYVTKPVDFDRFIAAIKQIDHFFVSVVRLPSGGLTRTQI